MKHCQPAALPHIPSGSPPLCHQHSAALPVLKVFPRDTLHLNSFFMSLGWDHWEERYLNLLPKTSACHFSPSLPTSVLSCLAFPGSCRGMDLFRLFLFQLWLETQGARDGKATDNMTLLRRSAVPRLGTDTGRVILRKNHTKIHFISSYQPVFI